jgi:hypothetical protein
MSHERPEVYLIIENIIDYMKRSLQGYKWSQQISLSTIFLGKYLLYTYICSHYFKQEKLINSKILKLS